MIGRPRTFGSAKPTLKRYSWSRLHTELVSMDEWTLVAEMARSDRARVEALIWRLEVYASGNSPRGSVEGFPLRALAATWRCEADEIARIYAALQDPDVGWLDDDVIVSFWARNPDEEDQTAPVRSAKTRRRKKIKTSMQARGATSAEILAEFERQGVGYPPSRCVTRDAVTVTTRAEQSLVRSAPVQNPQAASAEAQQAVQRDIGESVEGLTDAQAAELWLSTDGLRLVTTRMDERPQRAQQRIDRWRASVFDDPCILRRILDQAGNGDLATARFLVTVTDALERARKDPNQRILPLASVVPKLRTG